MKLQYRPFESNEDLRRMKALVSVIWKLEGPLSPMTVADLDWWMFQHEGVDPRTRIRLWSDGDSLRAFGWFSPPGSVDVVIHPEHREMSLFEEMIAWAEGKSRDRSAGSDRRGTSPSLEVWVLETDVSLPFLLGQLGFEPRPEHYVHLHRELQDPVEEPRLPDGYTLRSLRGFEEIAERVVVHRNAFAPSRVTVKSYRRVMESAGYRTDLDLVVEAPDGSFAAFAICWLDPENEVGEFEPLGTHSAHRRRGLARAILLEGMRRLRDRGAGRVMIYASSSGDAARRLYEDAGFRTVTRCRRFTR